jgi:hypothetical protein
LQTECESDNHQHDHGEELPQPTVDGMGGRNVNSYHCKITSNSKPFDYWLPSSHRIVTKRQYSEYMGEGARVEVSIEMQDVHGNGIF